ncbi:MAG TPA: alpha-amylase [Spirochaetia bacterium]|nr:alpha-amylase [Spirochaetia bacterium]HBI39106.1 alpha-amylase [Spirochaetia bacterium]
MFSCTSNFVDDQVKQEDSKSEEVLLLNGPEKAYSGTVTTTDVLLQGFHWNTWKYGTWNIIKNNAVNIKNGGFTMIWLPPPSKSADSNGYLPGQWRNYESTRGTTAQLQAALNALNTNGVKPLCDIVINHRVGTTGWGDFSLPAFADNFKAVTKNDEWGQGTGNYDSGTNYPAGRDLDHSQASVQTEIKNWLNQLKGMGYKGWRYDYIHGFNGSYIGKYNDATAPYFSVGELWPDIIGDYYASGYGVNYHRQKLMDWINATGGKSTAFDFTTKWQLQLAVSRSEYWRMKDPNGKAIGAIGWWPQMSTTFLDNHDTGPSPGDGGQNHWPFPGDKLEEGYAYILTHPGTPTVYWPHYFDYGTALQGKIKTLIALRKEKGIRSTSTLNIVAADSSKYAAIINGNLAMKIGPGSWSPGTGWTLRTSGNNWAVWTK